MKRVYKGETLEELQKEWDELKGWEDMNYIRSLDDQITVLEKERQKENELKLQAGCLY